VQPKLAIVDVNVVRCVAKTILSANRTDRQSPWDRVVNFSVRGFPG
jgi:hypothetical protein